MAAALPSPWLIWSLGAAFYAFGFFQRVAPSVIVGELMRDFALGGAMVGTLSAAYFYPYALIQVPVGVLLDRLGARRLLAGAAVLAALGSMLFALADNLAMAVLGRALVGVGAGVGYIGTLKLASSWFPPARFGLVAGLTLSVGTLGAMSAQLPLAAAVAAFGWRPAMVTAALLALVLAAALHALVRDHPPDAPAPSRGGHALDGLRIVAGRRITWLLAAVTGLIGAPVLTFAGLWGVPWLEQTRGLARAEAGAATSLMLAAWAIGGPFSGWLSDRLGRRRPVLLVGSAAMALGWLPLLLPATPLWLIVPLLAAIGLAGGSMIVAFALVRETFGSAAAGVAVGIVNSSVLLLSALMQTAFGAILDLGWEGATLAGARLYGAAAYRPALAALALLGGLATLAAWALPARPRRVA